MGQNDQKNDPKMSSFNGISWTTLIQKVTFWTKVTFWHFEKCQARNVIGLDPKIVVRNQKKRHFFDQKNGRFRGQSGFKGPFFLSKKT